ncbi:hypothetical protein ACHQM5_017787 [Ranunculus cassubicifolius]
MNSVRGFFAAKSSTSVSTTKVPITMIMNSFDILEDDDNDDPNHLLEVADRRLAEALEARRVAQLQVAASLQHKGKPKPVKADPVGNIGPYNGARGNAWSNQGTRINVSDRNSGNNGNHKGYVHSVDHGVKRKNLQKEHAFVLLSMDEYLALQEQTKKPPVAKTIEEKKVDLTRQFESMVPLKRKDEDDDIFFKYHPQGAKSIRHNEKQSTGSEPRLKNAQSNEKTWTNIFWVSKQKKPTIPPNDKSLYYGATKQ